jgi:predicted RNase H-like HicB family nuclease
MSNALHYSMLIAWSDEDQAYLVTLPEWADLAYMPITHGSTYQEAAKHGQDALESLVEMFIEDGRPLPIPQPVADQAAS